MTKIVNLHVHKNTLEKKKQRDLKAQAVTALKDMLNTGTVGAVAIVVFDKDQNEATYFANPVFRAAEFQLLLKDAIRALGNKEDLTLEEEAEQT